MIHDRKRSTAIVLVLLTSVVSVYAGDVAQFINLGFSPDSRIFMFAQHGITRDDGNPYAEIFTVNVPQNTFVSSGLASQVFDVEISPGQDGSGALFALLPEMRSIVDRYHINHLRQGRLIYLFVNGEEQRPEIQFRDFETGDRFRITMTQEARGSGPSGSAAFHLNVHVTYTDGSTIQRTVGRPTLFRDGVNRYRVKQVIVSPNEESLVMVVERITDTASGQRIRYMVETVHLR